MAFRPKLGVVKKTAPSISDPVMKRVVDTIYKDINSLAHSLNLPSGTHTFLPRDGKPGDIRLYEGTGSDGSTGYYLQGRVKDGWATVKMTLEAKNPEQVDTGAAPSGDINPVHITKYDVTRYNLDFNGDMGIALGQVARGDHNHDHQTLTNLVGEYHALSEDATGLVTLAIDEEGAAEGDGWARDDHGHKLLESITPDWTGEHKFHDDVRIGGTNFASKDLAVWTDSTFGRDAFSSGENAEGVTVKIYGPSTEENAQLYALDIEGHVLIDGELTVGVAIADNNDVSFAGNLDVGGYLDVVDDFEQGAVGDNNKNVTIYGQLGTQNIVTIVPHGTAPDVPALKVIGPSNAGHGQLRVGSSDSMFFDLKVDTSGNLLVDTIGNIQLLPEVGDDTPGQVLPKQTLLTDLGDFNRMFRSLFVGEIYAETLVAQDVLATIGGRISVAPTTMYEAFLGADPIADDEIYVRHNIFEKYDYAISKSAPMGLPQTEIFRIANDGEWAYTHITADTVTALENSADSDILTYIAAVASDWGIKPNCRIVCTTGGGTPINFMTNGPGGTQTLEDGSWIKLAGTPGHGFQEPPLQGINGAYKAMIKTADPEDDDTAYDKAPDLTAGEIDLRVPSDVFGDSTTKSYPDLVVYVGPFKYKVARSIAGIGLANRWQSGDAIMNLGHEQGDGFIEITSTETAYQDLGPTITMYGRDSTEGSSGLDLLITAAGTGYTTGKFTTTPFTGSGTGLEGTIRVVGGSGEITHLAPDVDTTTGLSTLGGTGYVAGDFLNVVQDGSAGLVKVVSIGQNWNAALPVASMGSLRSFVDYNESDAHGIALGKNLYTSTASSFEGITIDPQKGVRLFNTPLKMYTGTALNYHLESTGKYRVGPGLDDDGTFDYLIPEGQEGMTWDGVNLRIGGIINIESGPTFDLIQGNVDNISNLSGEMTDVEAIADGVILAYYQDGEPATINSLFTVYTSGNSYVEAEVCTTSADTGSGAGAKVVVTVNDGQISSATIVSSDAGSGYVLNDILTVIGAGSSNGKIKVSNQPIIISFGDYWIDTNQSTPTVANSVYRYQDVYGGSQDSIAWRLVDINDAVGQIYFDARNAQITADGKITTFYDDDPPTDVGEAVGDLWIDTDDSNKAHRHNGSAWVSIQDYHLDATLGTAVSDITNLTGEFDVLDANSITDGQIVTSYGADAPVDPDYGDWWIKDTVDPAVAYRYQDSNGLSQDALDWADLSTSVTGGAYISAIGAQGTADGKTVTFYGTSVPGPEGVSLGDLWVRSNEANALYRAFADGAYEVTGGGWQIVQDQDIATAQAAAEAAASAALSAQFDADAAQTELNEIASDTIITPSEKLVAKLLYDTIVAEYAGIAAQGAASGVSTTAYIASYFYQNNGLVAYIGAGETNVFGNMSTNTTIVRATWNTEWGTYYTAKQALLNAIANAAQVDADQALSDAGTAAAAAVAAQTAATAAQTAVAEMVDQIVLTDNALEIWTVNQGPDYKLAKFGSTTVFYDGVEDETANELVVMGAGGLQIKQNNVEIASYGAVTRIGVDSNSASAVRITSNTIQIGTLAQYSGSISPIYADSSGRLIIRNAAGDTMINTGSPFTISSGDVMTDGTTPYTTWNLDDSDVGIIQRQQVTGEDADYHYTELSGGFLAYTIGASSFNYPRATQWIRASKVNFGSTTTFLSISGDSNIQDMFDGNYNVQYHPVMLPTAKALPIGRANDSSSHSDGGSSVIKLNRTIDNTVNFESLNKSATSFKPRMAMYHGPVGGGGGYDADGYSMEEYRTRTGNLGAYVLSTTTNLRDSMADGDGSIESGTYSNGTNLFTDHDDNWGAGDVHDLWYPMLSGDNYDNGLFGNSSATNKLKIVLYIKMNYNYFNAGIQYGDFASVKARVMIRFGKKRWNADDFYSDHYAYMGHGNASANNTALDYTDPGNNHLYTAISSSSSQYPYSGHTMHFSDPYELILEPRTHADIEHNFIDERWGLCVRAFGVETTQTDMSITGYSFGIKSISWGEDPVKTYEYSGTGFASAFLVDAGQYNTSAGSDAGYPNPFN